MKTLSKIQEIKDKFKIKLTVNLQTNDDIYSVNICHDLLNNKLVIIILLNVSNKIYYSYEGDLDNIQKNNKYFKDFSSISSVISDIEFNFQDNDNFQISFKENERLMIFSYTAKGKSKKSKLISFILKKKLFENLDNEVKAELISNCNYYKNMESNDNNNINDNGDDNDDNENENLDGEINEYEIELRKIKNELKKNVAENDCMKKEIKFFIIFLLFSISALVIFLYEEYSKTNKGINKIYQLIDERNIKNVLSQSELIINKEQFDLIKSGISKSASVFQLYNNNQINNYKDMNIKEDKNLNRFFELLYHIENYNGFKNEENESTFDNSTENQQDNKNNLNNYGKKLKNKKLLENNKKINDKKIKEKRERLLNIIENNINRCTINYNNDNIYNNENKYYINNNLDNFNDNNLYFKFNNLKKSTLKLSLIYSSILPPDKFLSTCQNIEPTLTIIKTKKGAIFGGYTSKSWNAINNWTLDNDAFLFSFTRMKIYPIKQNLYYSINRFEKFLMVFNRAFAIYQNFSEKKNIAGDFKNNKEIWNNFGGENYELSEGEELFEVDKIEVFKVEWN